MRMLELKPRDMVQLNNDPWFDLLKFIQNQFTDITVPHNSHSSRILI